MERLRDHAHRLDGAPRDYEPLLRMARQRSAVLLGEATHGTHEFYAMRGDITRRLIEELGFEAVVIEGDWPDTLVLNDFVQSGIEAPIEGALSGFGRFPSWMWRNRAVQDFAAWLRLHNQPLAADARVGVYGMDLYSLYRSAEAVIDYLEGVDPDQAIAARALYRALDHVRDPQAYGQEAAQGLRPSCRRAAAELLVNLARHHDAYVAAIGTQAGERQFQAERNAHVVLNAEQYYRAMFEGRASTWNLRDAHMVSTIHAVQRHLRASGRTGRVVVWAHNSHLGDARATEMGRHGEWNVGQLLREADGDRTLLVGFTTYTGHVTAARDWHAPAEHRWVRPACEDSWERDFHRTRLDRFFLSTQGAAGPMLREPRLERAIGVVYRPESERQSHYFHASLAAQFDALFHLDETRAVEPLDVTERWSAREPADTYPFGL